MQNDAQIELVCVTDSNYAAHFAALVKSVETHKGNERIRVHAILDGVSEALLLKVRKSVPQLEIQEYHVADHPALELPPLLQISRATYLRLIIPELLSRDIDRVLYLDIDMIVSSSLIGLWNADLKGNPCGAVEDPGVDPTAFSKKYQLEGAGTYFNAGMMLIDMCAVRETDFLGKALANLIDTPKNYEFADQCALNEALWRDWTAVDAKWNFQREFLYEADKYKDLTCENGPPKIIHYTESNKPWKSDEWHPYAWLYWKFLRQTPFFDEIRKRDRIGYGRLLKFWLKYQLAILRSRVAAS